MMWRLAILFFAHTTVNCAAFGAQGPTTVVVVNTSHIHPEDKTVRRSHHF
jgi:hypothetical protein